jgi:DNA-binding response OmpR family regulator
MRGRQEPLGVLLTRAGALSEEELAELLELQTRRLPLASLAYALGLAGEESLTRALARQAGADAVLLDRSVIGLAVFEGAAPELALQHGVLPLAEDRHRLLVACEDPESVRDLLRELEFIKGKPVAALLSLQITLERTRRACQRARARGETSYAGPHAPAVEALGPASIAVVLADGSIATGAALAGTAARPAGSARSATGRDVPLEQVLLAITEEDSIESARALSAGGAAVSALELPSTEPNLAPVAGPIDSAAPTPMPPDNGSQPLVSTNTAVAQIMRRGGGDGIEIIDLDGRDGEEYRPRPGPPRVLVVDDDFASRQLLAKELAKIGYEVQTAEHGGEALAHITAEPPDAIVLDLMLPEIDGFQICRAVKQSRRYAGIAVVLISAVIDSGRVADEALRSYGADAYFEKPLHVEGVAARLAELLARRSPAEAGIARGEDCFERAMSHYRAGDIDAAMGELRRGIEEEPRSAKHHFVLANILHKKALLPEAIDEYEATLELRPDYFPALTRLAYLYYKQGYAARAIDTWRRSLPLCADPALRHNIELFMRKLIADLGGS